MFVKSQSRPAQSPTTVWGGVLALTVGLAVTSCSAPSKNESQAVAGALVTTASPSPSVTIPTECDIADTQQTFNEEVLFCTENEVGAFVRMDLSARDKVVAARAAEKAVKEAAAVRVAEEKKAKEAVARKVATEKAAADKAAARKAAEKKAAAEKAAASAYPNCSAAASAGVFNIPAGAAGYGPHLDRDADGVACENSAANAPAPVEQPVQAAQPVQPAAPSVPYPNCSAARAAGAAPVYAGQPGYGPHLDRDSDGVGCE